MGAVGQVARVVRRRLMGALVLLAVVTGVAGGLATGLVSGGLRARSAGERLMAESRLPDLLVAAPELTAEQAERIRAIDGVDGVGLVAVLGVLFEGADYFNTVGTLDDRYGVDVDRSRLLRGRAPTPGSPSEVVVGETIARGLGVDVGDTIRFDSFSPAQLAVLEFADEESSEEPAFGGPTVELDVVGISRHPGDLASADDVISQMLVLPSGVMDRYAGVIGEHVRLAFIDIGQSPTPAQEGAVASAVLDVVGPDAALEEAGEQAGGPLLTTLDFVGWSMIVLAAAVGVAGLVVGAAVMARTVARAADETAGLTAVGMTRGERALAIAAAIGPAALAAGLVAVALAAVTATFVPFGLARDTDPDPGLHLGVAVVAVGVALTVAVVLALAGGLAAAEVRRTGPPRQRRSAVVTSLARHGVPVGAVVGVDLAVGSRRRGVNRLAVVATCVATAAGVAALVLTASIGHLERTPAAYGWTWDVVVHDEAVEALVDDPAVAAVGLVVTGTVALDGRPTIVRGMTSLKGAPPLAIVQGRLPERGEIALGRRTMRDLGVDIGDTVRAEGAAGSRELQVVGQAVLAGIVDSPEASWGGAVAMAELDALGLEDSTGSGGAVSLVEGADREAFAARVEAASGVAPTLGDEPAELARLREIASFPWLLGAFLLSVGFVAALYATVSTVRGRRRDLAVLRSLGLAPRGLVQAVCTQAAVLTVVGAAIGIPLGLVAGHAVWRAVAGSLGVVVVVDVPWPAIAGAGVVGCAIVAALAIVPARNTARGSVAAALRTE